jgi:ribosomal protein S18 acetylase RimI-like enzyme
MNTERVVIREMEIDDLPAAFELGDRVFSADLPSLYRTWDEYELVDTFSSDGEFCLVAERDDELVAFAIGSVIRKRRGAWTYGYLSWIAVEPRLAWRGIARRLVARLTELFIEAGVRMMVVDTDPENERAVEFFRRLGFGRPVEHVYMTRNLTDLPGYRRHRDREGELVDED